MRIDADFVRPPGHHPRRVVNMNLRRIALLGFLLMLATARGRAETMGHDDLPITITRLSERVIVLDCLDVNVVAVAADSGVVVIDTSFSPSLMRSLAAVIEHEFGRRDFRYVINTHGHWDHCSGNQVFPQATIVAHEACPEFMRHNRADTFRSRYSLGRRLARTEAGGDQSSLTAAEAGKTAAENRARRMVLSDLQDGYVLAPPTRTFSDRLTLDLGDLTFQLCFAGAAHTNNDILIYVPQEKLLLSGDLFCSATAYCFPVDPLVDVRRLADQIAILLQSAAGIETIVPGHGETLSRADLVQLRESLLQRYVELDGNRSGAALLASISEDQGVDAALDRYRRLLGADSGVFYFKEEEVNRLAHRMWWRGQAVAAINVLELSLSRFPKSPLLYDSLGNVYLERGDTASAVASYRQSLALFPENRSLAEVIGALED
jgi:glyoxylase-like metal-dependent hydrolase (beta-lactamase superfamily II)